MSNHVLMTCRTRVSDAMRHRRAVLGTRWRRLSAGRTPCSWANSTAGGQAAYVFGEDPAAARALGQQHLAGEVKINGASVLDMSPESVQSFFGSSGIGGHGDRDLLGFHSGKQVIGRDLVAPPL